jgi:hypothetical protein
MVFKDTFHDFDYSLRVQQRIKSPWSGWDGRLGARDPDAHGFLLLPGA